MSSKLLFDLRTPSFYEGAPSPNQAQHHPDRVLACLLNRIAVEPSDRGKMFGRTIVVAVLYFRQSKTGQVVNVKAPAPLRDELKAGAREGDHVVATKRGAPYTRDGLQTNLWKLVKNLTAEELVKAGLSFHGLRHSLGDALYDLGLDREARKTALGHSSNAASLVYERGGNRRAASVPSTRLISTYDGRLLSG